MDLTEGMDERIQEETSALELERRGEALITVAKALLGMGLILVCFVEISVRTGSRLSSGGSLSRDCSDCFWWLSAYIRSLRLTKN